MSDRFNISSTKNGPSVRAAVRTHVELPVVGVVVVPPVAVVSVESVARVAAAAQLTSSDCDTTTLAAPFAAKPSKSRRLNRVRGGKTFPRRLLAMADPERRVFDLALIDHNTRETGETLSRCRGLHYGVTDGTIDGTKETATGSLSVPRARFPLPASRLP